MGGNGRGGIVTGRSRGSRGGGGISTVDSSIIWDKTPPATDPPSSVNGYSFRAVSPASVNGYSLRIGVSSIGCATTTLNASSFKGSGAVASKNRIMTGSVIVVSPLVVVV